VEPICGLLSNLWRATCGVQLSTSEIPVMSLIYVVPGRTLFLGNPQVTESPSAESRLQAGSPSSTPVTRDYALVTGQLVANLWRKNSARLYEGTGFPQVRSAAPGSEAVAGA
jgi:hypothetical protein